jgi:hypothetical protein
VLATTTDRSKKRHAQTAGSIGSHIQSPTRSLVVPRPAALQRHSQSVAITGLALCWAAGHPAHRRARCAKSEGMRWQAHHQDQQLVVGTHWGRGIDWRPAAGFYFGNEPPSTESTGNGDRGPIVLTRSLVRQLFHKDPSKAARGTPLDGVPLKSGPDPWHRPGPHSPGLAVPRE